MIDAAQVQAVLDELKFPVAVRKWEIETGPDATGDDSVWVWAVLDDAEFADEKRSWPIRTQIRDTIRDAVSSAARDSDPWVYVRFRALSEV